jgi:hypothetical protein
MKIPIGCFLALSLVGCTPMVLTNSGPYPLVTHADRADIAQYIYDAHIEEPRANRLVQMVMKAEERRPLTEGEANGVQVLLDQLRANQAKAASKPPPGGFLRPSEIHQCLLACPAYDLTDPPYSGLVRQM